MMKTKRIFLALAFVCLSYFSMGQTTWTNLSYNPDVSNIEQNPMKGWMPGYSGINTDFPYSVDHFYIKLKDVFTGWGQCDWTAFETELDRITSGGRHVVTRFWIDYPNQERGLPDFLLPVVTMYDDNSPDWNDEDLMLALEDFIALFGAQYDGDPRIAMIEAGLYGFWGEWHTYPYNGSNGYDDWQMTQANKDRILQAYKVAFQTTHIGLRQSNHASTYEDKMSFGYYDDSFAYNTLCTGSWCFWNGNIVPNGITDIYQYHPIAGELRPEIQKTIFETIPNGTANGEEDLETCINTTHLSFMKAYFLFNGYWDANLGQRIYPTQTEKDNALVSHKMMGYEFFVRSTRIVPQTNGKVFIELNMQNKGVAPIYYDWQVEFAAKNIASGQIYNIGTADWNITGILPTSTDYYKSATTLALSDGSYKILMRLKNPLEDINANAFPLRFANSTQDADVNGWLTLGMADISTGGDPVGVTGVTITNCSTNDLNVNDTYQLLAEVAPSNASNQTVSWSTSNSAIVTVDVNGKLAAIAQGSATITVSTNDGGFTDHCVVNVAAASPLQSPYGGVNGALPGQIEGEHYDVGGQNMAYNDDASKSGDLNFRPGDNVDVAAKASASNGYSVGYTNSGEWLEYTVDVTEGDYDLTLYYFCNASPGQLQVSLNDVLITTISGIVSQNDWNLQASITIPNIHLPGGNGQVLRLEYVNGAGFDIDAVHFTLLTPSIDEITNFVAPGQVTGGDAFSAEVTYSATTSRDIRVFVQLNSSPWTTYGATTVPVEVGSGVATVYVSVDPAIPIATGAYKIVANLLPTGGAWADRLDEAIITGVDAISTLSSDSRLSDLTVDGVTIPGFLPEVLSYNIELPAGTVIVPFVAAVTYDANATAMVSHASALPGSTSVLVTAEDGVTTTNYMVNFTVAAIDEITSFVAPTQVTAGESFIASVAYTATVARDIRVFLQLNSDPWTTNGATTVKVAQGSGSIDVIVVVDPATTVATAAYKIVANLLPEGGAWLDRLDESTQTGVDVLSSVCIDDLPWSDANFSVVKSTVSYSSGPIDISCAGSATISVDLEGLGPMEKQDYCNVYFRVDGGAQQVLSENSNSFPFKTVTASVSGSSVEIFINSKTSFTDEIYNITNLSVTADGLKSLNLQEPTASTTAVDEKIMVYPNPVNETLYVVNQKQEKMLIRFFSAQGKLLYAVESKLERTAIDIKALNYKGLVMLQVATKEQYSTYRILVK